MSRTSTARLIYGVPLDSAKTTTILRAKLSETLKECNDHYPEICALAKQEQRLREVSWNHRFFPQRASVPEVKRVVPSLFYLCSSKIRNHDDDANHKGLLLLLQQRLPAEVKQRMAKERVVQKLMEFSSQHFQSDSTYETVDYAFHESLWSLLGLVMLEGEGGGGGEEGPFSFTRNDHSSSSGEVTPGIVTVNTRFDDSRDHCIHFLTLGGRCTNEMPLALHELEDCQRMVVSQAEEEGRPSWWAHALKILQIDNNARPGFYLCVDTN